MTTTPEHTIYTFTLEDDDVQALYGDLRLSRDAWNRGVAREHAERHLVRELAVMANQKGLSVVTQPTIGVSFKNWANLEIVLPEGDENWDIAEIFVTALARPYMISEGS